LVGEKDAKKGISKNTSANFIKISRVFSTNSNNEKPNLKYIEFAWNLNNKIK